MNPVHALSNAVSASASHACVAAAAEVLTALTGCKRHVRWLAIEDAISEQGWTLVLLLRAAPFVPCCVLNYTLSLTSVRLRSGASWGWFRQGHAQYARLAHFKMSISVLANGLGACDEDVYWDENRHQLRSVCAPRSSCGRTHGHQRLALLPWALSVSTSAREPLTRSPLQKPLTPHLSFAPGHVCFRGFHALRSATSLPVTNLLNVSCDARDH